MGQMPGEPGVQEVSDDVMAPYLEVLYWDYVGPFLKGQLGCISGVLTIAHMNMGALKNMGGPTLKALGVVLGPDY